MEAQIVRNCRCVIVALKAGRSSMTLPYRQRGDGAAQRWNIMATSALQQLIGQASVDALARSFPGQRIYVPWSCDNAIANFSETFAPLIGRSNCHALLECYGGLRIIVPSQVSTNRGKLVKELNVKRVAIRTKQGASARAIAAEMGVSPRSVHTARRQARMKGWLDE